MHKFRSRKFITQIIKKYYLFLSFFDDQKYHIDYDLNAKKKKYRKWRKWVLGEKIMLVSYTAWTATTRKLTCEENLGFLTLHVLSYIAPVKVKYMCKFALLEMYIFIVIMISNVNWSLPKFLDKYKIRISYIYSQLNPK